jgi:hypothetical protein
MVQRRKRRSTPNLAAIGGKNMPKHLAGTWADKPYEHQADGFLRCASSRAGDSGKADRPIASESFPGSLGHFKGDWFADSPKIVQDVL